MNRADIAIIVSMLSLLVSLGTLGWSIYKEVGLRARVRVSCNVMMVIKGNDRVNKVVFGVVNHGPGQVQIKGLTLKNPWWARLRGKSKYFLLLPEWDNPLSTPLPATLAVGDQASFIIPYEEDCFLSSPIARAGVLDTFNREHWAAAKQVRRAREQFRKDFGAKPAA